MIPAVSGVSEIRPPDTDTALVVLKSMLTEATPVQLGLFFAQIGLEAAPDEVLLWDDDSFIELITEFSDMTPDTAGPDSLVPLLEGLPLWLLLEAP